MNLLIPAASRGNTRLGWLDSRHSFSFADYRDPSRMGWGALRVINDDRVDPGAGFGTHAHRDMEIISYVTQGRMAHRDSTGEQGLIEAGQFQLMSAGSGIRHSEFNASATQELRFLQIWIVPATRGDTPGYQQHGFERRSGLHLIATPDGRDATLRMRQDATLSRLILADGERLVLEAGARRRFVHVVEGRIQVGQHELCTGDGIGLVDPAALEVHARSAAEALLFDLPA